MRVLLVDDAELNRVIAQRILELEGARVETACDGREAVARVERDGSEFDVVLMDIQMPELDGAEATNRIRQQGSHADLPIIALSAGALAGERQRPLVAGMNDFITKPFDPEVLVQSVRMQVEQRAGRGSEMLGCSSAPMKRGSESGPGRESLV